MSDFCPNLAVFPANLAFLSSKYSHIVEFTAGEGLYARCWI